MEKENAIIYDIEERAIIECFEHHKTEILKRKIIKKTASKLCGKNDENMKHYINKLVKKNYLIKIEEPKNEVDIKDKRPGLFKINRGYNYIFECEPLLSETEPIEAAPEGIEIPSERREKHTLSLYPAIGYWIDYFPMPPESGDSKKFFKDVKLCEQHNLYHDLVNHLPHSGFKVCDRWEQYKAGVKEIHVLEGDLQRLIESDISGMFTGLKLRYVKSWEYMMDYDCYLPALILECIINAKKYTELRDIKLEKAQTEEEYDRIESELLEEYLGPDYMADRIEKMDLTEIGDSIVGEDNEYAGYIKYIRVPKKDRDILTQGKDKAASYLLRPPAEVDKKAAAIMKKVALLYREREYMIKELNRSIDCLCFSGDCRYLRGGSK